tara:strand:+ start:25 stop:1068 length:1044 start_codon:yes stop_codon:yes gene_type:complete
VDHSDFFEELVSKANVSKDHPIVKYLFKKTLAVDRGSKARRSLGNLYAIQVLAEDYVNRLFDGSQFSILLNRMREKPFGSKLQNHPLDNRLNDEFKRQLKLEGDFLPVQEGGLGKLKTRKISEKLLTFNSSDPLKMASFIVKVVDSFSNQIISGEKDFIDKINSLRSKEKIMHFLEEIYKVESNARLFEITSFCILKHYYLQYSFEWNINNGEKKISKLNLYKTGRSNANDGGIDFVLKPLGRFFQVTENLDFKKFFLDFEKVNRVPISFIVKSEYDSETVLNLIKEDASKLIESKLLSEYMKLFEEMFTNIDLRKISNSLLEIEVIRLNFINDLQKYFKVEYGHFD